MRLFSQRKEKMYCVFIIPSFECEITSSRKLSGPAAGCSRRCVAAPASGGQCARARPGSSGCARAAALARPWHVPAVSDSRHVHARLGACSVSRSAAATRSLVPFNSGLHCTYMCNVDLSHLRDDFQQNLQRILAVISTYITTDSDFYQHHRSLWRGTSIGRSTLHERPFQIIAMHTDRHQK